MNNLYEKAKELLHGGYDLHVHTSPSAFTRALDGFQLVREADNFGMAGVMLKSHYEPTAIRAALINRYSGCNAKAYGALALNWPVGGLNVYAVENALKVGAKIIWMPTRDSKNSLMFGNMEGDFFNREGITILTEKNTLKPVVYEIMQSIKKHDAFLATGHLSMAESILLCREGRKSGVNMILTHPEFCRTMIPAEVQAQLAGLGVLIEKNWFNVAAGMVSIEQLSANIRMAGAHHCYIATDRGQQGAASPPEELCLFVTELLKQEFTEAEIRDMLQKVPKSIVD